MELGATVCLPKNPLCLLCPLTAMCRARQAGTAPELPVKLRRQIPVRLEGTLLVVRKGRDVLLRQRAADARRMAGFWDLPTPEDLPAARVGESFGEIRHSITHHHYTFEVAAATVRRPGRSFRWFDATRLCEIPLSTIARKALKRAGIPEHIENL